MPLPNEIPEVSIAAGFRSPGAKLACACCPVARILELAGGQSVDKRQIAAARQAMNPMEKPPFVPTEIHVGTVMDENGVLAILSIQTTEGRLDLALDRQAAEAIVNAVNAI